MRGGVVLYLINTLGGGRENGMESTDQIYPMIMA